MAVSFDPVDDLRRFRTKEGLEIGLARDPDEGLAKTLGLVHAGVFQGKDAYFPTKVLIDEHNRVLWAFAEDDLRVRAGPDTILEAIDGVVK
jgi:peroxiredoxin